MLLVTAICVLWWLWKEVRPVPEVRSPDDNPTERFQSIEALVRDGEDSVPLLLEMLSDTDPKTRCDGLLGLGRIGSPSNEVRDAVRARLDDDDPRVRLYAIPAYKQICHDQHELGELAVRLLAHPDGEIRKEARETLETGSPEAVSAVIPLLSHESPGDRLVALEILSSPKAKGRRGADVIEAAHQVVNDTDPGVRRLAVGLVVRHGACSQTEALAWLRDGDRGIRQLAVGGIDWHLPEAGEAVSDLLQLVDLSKEGGFRETQRYLKALKTLARPAVPDLLRLAEKSEHPIRLEIIETLAEIGAEPDDLVRLSAPLLLEVNVGPRACRILARASPDEAKRNVSLLIPQLQKSDGAVNVRVLHALGAFGELAGEAVPALVPLLSQNDLDSVCLVAGTLGKIAPETAAHAVPQLVASIDLEHLDPFTHNPNTHKQPPAIDALAELGRSAREAVPTLLRVLDLSNTLEPKRDRPGYAYNYLRPLVIRALVRTGGDRADVVAALRETRTLGDKIAWVGAAEWLASSDITTPAVRTALEEMRNDKNPSIRVNAIWAIVNQTADRDEAVTKLIDEFASDDPAIQTAAAIALGKLGTAASSAAPALRNSLNNDANSIPNDWRGSSAVNVQQEDWRCRSVATAVRWALARIEPHATEERP
jgi:HEAT repeat protein